MSENAIVTYMKNDKVLQGFVDVLGNNEREAKSYITNVLVAVRGDDRLMSCTPQSIYLSAIRAATLRLSVDPTTGQAYLVPYAGVCVMQPGYKGYMTLAMRTGKYRFINVTPIYEGETVEIDRLSGRFAGFGGKQVSDKRIGWLGAFEMMDGYSHAIYMTVEEIHEHKEKYSKGYDRKDSAWKTATEKMEKKTVLLQLLRGWGTFDPADQAVLSEIEGEQDIIDIPEIDPDLLDAEVIERTPASQHLQELGYSTASDDAPTIDEDLPDWAISGRERTVQDFLQLCKQIPLDKDQEDAIFAECDREPGKAYDAVLRQYWDLLMKDVQATAGQQTMFGGKQ